MPYMVTLIHNSISRARQVYAPTIEEAMYLGAEEFADELLEAEIVVYDDNAVTIVASRRVSGGPWERYD